MLRRNRYKYLITFWINRYCFFGEALPKLFTFIVVKSCWALCPLVPVRLTRNLAWESKDLILKKKKKKRKGK